MDLAENGKNGVHQAQNLGKDRAQGACTWMRGFRRTKHLQHRLSFLPCRLLVSPQNAQASIASKASMPHICYEKEHIGEPINKSAYFGL